MTAKARMDSGWSANAPWILSLFRPWRPGGDCSDATLAAAEAALGHRFPQPLRGCYRDWEERSVQRYRRRQPGRPPSQTWRPFLANHAQSLWAADLLTVHTIASKTLYVLLFITHGRRELVHVDVKAHPTSAWVWRQLIEATTWGRPTHLIRDRDAVYGGAFVTRAESLGIQTVLTPLHAPRANAMAERVIGTIRRECLDHYLIVNEAHLRTVLNEYVTFSNRNRPHRSLHLEPSLGAPPSVPFAARPIRSRSVLGGLHHVYERAARRRPWPAMANCAPTGHGPGATGHRSRGASSFPAERQSPLLRASQSTEGAAGVLSTVRSVAAG